MDYIRIKYLLSGYLDNKLSPLELEELATYINRLSNVDIQHIMDEIDTPSHIELSEPDTDLSTRINRVYSRLKIDIDAISEVDFKAVEKTKSSTKRHVVRLAAVAAVACIITLGAGLLWIDYRTKNTSKGDFTTAVEDVNPAYANAVIALENGDKIQIDTSKVGLLYNKNGLKVFQNAEGEIRYENSDSSLAEESYVTLITPKGGFKKIKLSDGTEVELNAASSLRYPLTFKHKKRDVYLEGEAYFDVHPDKESPFRVISDKQTIEVLGTSFNVISSSTQAKTTLLEGKVKILVANKSYMLNPGEQAVVKDDVVINEVKVAEEVAWKNDQFIFDNSNFIEVLKQIENWYNVQLIFPSAEIKNVNMSGRVSRSVKLSELLKVIELNSTYKFKIEGRRVLVIQY